MTLIAGIVCSDGIVFASDSASTDFDAGSKQSVQKIHELQCACGVAGWSGDYGVIQRITEALPPKAHDTYKRIRQELRAAIIPILQEAVQGHSPYPQQPYHQPPFAISLFAFVCGGTPYLLEVERDGRDTLYDGRMGGFAAIGAGKPWAHAIFRPFLENPRDLALGKVMLYRVMDDSINLAAGGLALPIQMWQISLDGVVTKLGKDDLEDLRNARELWARLELEAVGKLLTPAAAPTVTAEIPIPTEAQMRSEEEKK